MSQETNNQENTEHQYTEEQLKSMRAEMIRYYSEEVKFLKKQEEFERLSADHDEHEDQEGQEEDPVKDTTEKPKRTLKTVE